MRISDWSSDVCSSDLPVTFTGLERMFDQWVAELPTSSLRYCRSPVTRAEMTMSDKEDLQIDAFVAHWRKTGGSELANTQSFINGLCNLLGRSEEHTSELQSIMRISYAVFYLKKK